MPAALPAVTLEVYYSPACIPCRLELPAIAEFSRVDGRRVQFVILDQTERARDELRSISERLAESAIVSPYSNPRTALREAGDSDGILPYARSVMSDGKSCASWRGELTLSRARSLVAACIRKVTSPARR